MILLKFLKDYWTQMVFFIAMLGIVKAFIDATKCSLRNDMLEIWDKCKDTKTITKYQLESFMTSRDLYYKFKGDGFIHTIDEQIQHFEIKD